MSEPKSLWAQHIEDACPEGPFPPEESTRHPKWKAVPPGTVIPAGQPYAVEYRDAPNGATWTEYRGQREDRRAGFRGRRDDLWEWGQSQTGWFVDSSWRPPLVLPTEPTWGIAVHKQRGAELGHWWVCADGWMRRSQTFGKWEPESVIEFVPLTDEQVARIEAAR